MKITENTLRRLIREEYLRGVPEFMLRKAADDCVEEIRQQIKRFIQLRSESPAQARQMTQAANKILSELDDELYELIEEKLWAFVQQTLGRKITWLVDRTWLNWLGTMALTTPML